MNTDEDEKITITEWKQQHGEPGNGGATDQNGRIQGCGQAYFPTEPDYCEDPLTAEEAATPQSERAARERARIEKIIRESPRYTPTEDSITSLRDERSRLMMRRIHQTLSGAEQHRIEHTTNEIKSLELRIHEDEQTLLGAAA